MKRVKLKGKNSPEKLLIAISKLDAVEFFGVCKILGVKIYVEATVKKENENGEIENITVELHPRKFEDIWEEICDVVWTMNGTRRKNLGKIVYPATKKKEK